MIRSLTDGPVGRERDPRSSSRSRAIEAILAEGIDVLATGFGDADRGVELAHAHGARVFHRCETPDEARRGGGAPASTS